MSFVKDSFCSYCAYPFNSSQDSYPKTCSDCGNVLYKNPLPVVVPIVTTYINNKLSVLIIKRNIEPQKGRWALPGGYLECNETWQEGSGRELFEETGLVFDIKPLSLLEVTSAKSGNLLIFSYCNLPFVDISYFTPNSEVSELKFISDIEDLAFPTHTDIVSRIFNVEWSLGPRA